MKNKRWQLIVLMFLTSTLGYMDRSAIGIAAPLIARDLKLTASQMGMVFSAFFIGYSLFALIGGRTADIFGPKRVIVISIGVWSLFCGLTALAGGLIYLLIVRVLFGAGEGPFPPAQAKLVGHWFPRAEQATVIGLYGSGESMGGALASVIVATLAAAVSWRFSFGLIALLGLAIMLIWLFAVNDWPEMQRWIGEEERELIVSKRASESVMVTPTGSLFSVCVSPGVLATAVAWFGYAYVLFFFLSWFPSYLMIYQHLSLESAGFVTALPWLCGFMGRLSGGLLSDSIFRRTGNALLARKLVVGGGLAVAAICIGFAGFVTGIVSAVMLTNISVFAIAITASGYWALILDLVPQDKVGGVSGFGLCAGSLAGIVAPTVTGLLLDTSGSFLSAFIVSGVVAGCGAIAVCTLIRHDAGRSRRPHLAEGQ